MTNYVHIMMPVSITTDSDGQIVQIYKDDDLEH